MIPSLVRGFALAIGLTLADLGIEDIGWAKWLGILTCIYMFDLAGDER